MRSSQGLAVAQTPAQAANHSTIERVFFIPMKIGPYELNSIITGDARELAAQLPNESLDLLITDPPYFLPVNTYVGVRGSRYFRRTVGDMSVMQTYFDVMIAEFSAKLKSTGTAYVFCDGQSYPLIYRAMYPHFKYVRPLIWDKAISYNGYTWRHQHEIIAWGEGHEAERVPTGDGDILRCRGVLQEDRLHPAEKPAELITKLMDKHKAARIVFDPYSGSSPTAVAASLCGKDFICFEIDPATAERARERVANTQPPLPFVQATQGTLL